MHRIHGLGLRDLAQIGRNALGRDHFQSLGQDWTVPSEVPSEASIEKRPARIASKRRKVRQPGKWRKSFVKNSTRPKLLSTRQEREVASLRELSARVGGDPLLVQASNGNTSIKLDGILWIKASGRWLAHAMQEEMFVPLELAEVKESIENGTDVAWRYARKDGLRPSIETAMHAVLRHRVVIHVHSINAIVWAIRVDGPDQLKERLEGLHWQWIPY